MSRYTFSHWEDGSTNPTRTIGITTDTSITATYELAPIPPPSPLPSWVWALVVAIPVIGVVAYYLRKKKKK